MNGTPPHLAGHRFVEKINEGGFAQVFLYRRLSMDRDVAVKVLRSSSGHGGTGQDFDREARIMARLSFHPNIVTIYDHGTGPDGRPYLIMEYCPPPNLKERSERERLPVPEAVRIGIQIAGALETAHRSGILHRDVKPANILINHGGEPVLTDFGISSTSLVPNTTSGALSLPWAAPEVAEGSRAAVASDVYGLAATLYSLLTGRSPYQRLGEPNEWSDLLRRLRSGVPEPLDRPDLPQSVEQVLMTALARDPRGRPGSAVEFATRLYRSAPGRWALPSPRIPDSTAKEVRRLTETTRTGTAPAPAANTGTAQTELRGSGDPDKNPVPSSLRPADPDRTPGQPDQDTATRKRGAEGPTGVDPEADDPGGVGAGGVGPDQVGPAGDDPDHTVIRGSDPPPERPSRIRVLVGAALVTVVLAVAAILVLPFERTPKGADPDPDATSAAAPVADPPQSPQHPVWTVAGDDASLTWRTVDTEPGDTYQWRTLDPAGAVQSTDETTVTVAGAGKESICVEVIVVRAGQASDAVQTCSPQS